MLFVIFILNKQKFSVITSFLLDKCLGRRKDVLAYRENFSSKCALFFVLGEKKEKPRKPHQNKGILTDLNMYYMVNGLSLFCHGLVASGASVGSHTRRHRILPFLVSPMTGYNCRLCFCEEVAAQNRTWTSCRPGTSKDFDSTYHY